MSDYQEFQDVPVLMVDDRPENLTALEELLCGNGLTVFKATSGNDALRLTLKQDFALVLLDVQMPDMDGFETAELMRANPKTRHIPIIFVTAGMKELQFQFKGYDAGAVDYLAKPIEPIVLQSKVRIFSEMYWQRNELERHKQNLEAMVEQRTVQLREVGRELVHSNSLLESRNQALLETERQLRAQITEFYQTQDQLVATEEMLRVQIEEYQLGQKQLFDSNRNLQMLFDLSPLAIVISSSPNSIILEINRTFTTLFGLNPEQVVGKSWNELDVWPDSVKCQQIMDSIARQEALSGFSVAICTQQNEQRTVLIYSNRMEYMGEHCLIAVLLDITEQKRLEDQLRQTQKMDLIGQLAGGVAHDFNNMLSAIIGSSEMLHGHVQDNPKAVKLVNMIYEAANRSADLTRQLLYFSRKGESEHLDVCIDETLQSALSFLERTIDKNITLQTKLDARKTVVNGDSTLLQNALLNLGVNARDAMPDGGTIIFSTANVVLDGSHCGPGVAHNAPGEFIEITVSDTGVGMTKEVVEHIFEPFFTTKEAGKGTGLGLAAVYGTVRDHKGSVSVESKPGVGTTFKLYLPLSESVSKKVVQVSHKSVQGGGGVLLVDDEVMVRSIAGDLLEAMGYKVFLAEDGVQALDVYAREREQITFVLMDMVMPNMSGKEVLQRLIQADPGVKVLVTSGYHQEGTMESLMELGARGFIQKPYTKSDLCAALEKVLTA